MYAVIKTGGKQYRVTEGQKLRVEKLAGDPGNEITFNEVLLIGGSDSPKIGQPFIGGASVSAKIAVHDRGDKIVIFKFRRRKNYRRKNGHRQPFTDVLITSIKG
jgi:large subunit ribosomal protein L21